MCAASVPRSDPRLRTHSNIAAWDQQGFVAQALRAEGLNDTEIGRLLGVIPRTVKARRARVADPEDPYVHP